jgi:hypothetical protein
MPRLAVSIKLGARLDEVHRMVLNPSEPLLPKGAPLFHRLSGQGELGSVYRFQFRRLGLRFRVDAAITELTPTRIAYQGRSGWQMTAQVDLEPMDQGTRLRFQMQYRFPWPLRWLIPGPLVRLGVWQAVARFQQMVESASLRQSTIERESI